MDRRDFLSLMAAAGAVPALDLAAGASAAEAPASVPAGPQTQTRAAFQKLLALLQDIDTRWLGAERHIAQPLDIADGHRTILHLLAAGLDFVTEADPQHPVFKRMISPSRKFQGDNPDALYFSAYIDPTRTYRIRGTIDGAVYTSISFEIGSVDGHYPTGVARAINDKDLTIAKDGSYEILIGPDAKGPNAFKLDPGIGSITTRHYYENNHSIALAPEKAPSVSIACLDPVGPKTAPTEASVAKSIERLANWMSGMTLEQPNLAAAGKIPPWVSTTPNRFNPPGLPDGSIGFANRDAWYAMAPYFLKPDEALVIDGRFPKCRFANVVLWNRFLQTYDFDAYQVSLNRKQTQQASDGKFRLVLAHSDPHLPNWLNTEGRQSGLIWWRFIFPEEPIPPLVTRVLPFSDLAKL